MVRWCQEQCGLTAPSPLAPPPGNVGSYPRPRQPHLETNQALASPHPHTHTSLFLLWTSSPQIHSN